jgi:hypothetical protein
LLLQVRKLNLGQKKAHLIEIQVNGGSISDKVDFATKLFEKAVTVDSVFNVNEMIDTIAITKVRSAVDLSVFVGSSSSSSSVSFACGSSSSAGSACM